PGREQLRRELRRLLSELGAPAIVVTHDRVEALALGDSVIVLDEGRVCQHGQVHEVFSRPTTPAIARIVGVETIESAQVRAVADGLATVAVGSARLIALDRDAAIGPAYVCIRAEDVILERRESITSSARNQLQGRIHEIQSEGPMVRVTLNCGFL